MKEKDPPRILIIEDSIVSGVLMEATINRKQPDYQVKIRKSLAGGFEEFAEFAPNLVIIDLVLPDAGVEQTIPAIKVFREKACVIAFTGHPELEDDARRAGANDFMAKGIGEDACPLIERINALMPQCLKS